MATLIQTLQHTLETKDPRLSVETKRILLKEVLQAYVLDFVYNHPHYRHLNFYGGTCLHTIYNLNRLSEDLDFDNQEGLDLSQIKNHLLTFFQKDLLFPDVNAHTQTSSRGILRITLRFPVLYSLGLSDHKTENLHLKVEVSSHKQVAIIQHTPLIVHGRSLVARHFSLETMMAGKILACLERNFEQGGIFIKGRDFYDLLWFMQQHIHPLETKLASDGRKSYTVESAMKTLQTIVKHIRPRDLAIDLIPLFESTSFIKAWLESFHENFQRLVTYYLSHPNTPPTAPRI